MTERGGTDPTRDPEVLAAALAVGRHLDLEACLGALVEGASRLLGGTRVLGYRYGGSGVDLDLVADSGPDPAPEGLRRLDASLLDQAVPEGGGRFDDGGPLRPEIRGPVLVLPVVTDAGRRALMVAPGACGDDAARRAATFARASAPAVSNALRVADLKELMVRDDTADCFNRRYFDEHLTSEVARAVRFGNRLALIFLDMDNLKGINTRHGHASGSRVLFEASRRINRSIRAIDTLFRFGGDEFCIVLPGTGVDGAREVAERVRRAIAAEPFLRDRTPGERLTASLGVAAFPEHGRSAEELLEAADRAMRQVKTARKNAIGVPRDASAGA